MYNAHWIHSLPYSKFIELTLLYVSKDLILFNRRMSIGEEGLNRSSVSIESVISHNEKSASNKRVRLEALENVF